MGEEFFILERQRGLSLLQMVRVRREGDSLITVDSTPQECEKIIKPNYRPGRRYARCYSDAIDLPINDVTIKAFIYMKESNQTIRDIEEKQWELCNQLPGVYEGE